MNTHDNVVSNTTPIKAYRPETITYLTSEERSIFLIVFSMLLVVSFGGNLAAIVVTTQRNHRFIQKTCIISLSLSDLIMTAAYCSNNMETFSHPMINWTLGKFMCSFIPMAQIFGLVVNLASMVVIALDRYINVVKTLAHRWNPTPPRCILGFVFIWILCIGISYPIYPMFEIKFVRVYHDLSEGTYMEYPFCVTSVKEELKKYYISIAALVFSTLWGCLLYLNCSIAHLVWSHRKPVVAVPIPVEPSLYSIETSSTQLTGAAPQPLSYASPGRKMRIGACRRSPQVRRRLRTFKIIVFCMLAFTMCRLPFWLHNIIKLSYKQTEKFHWLMLYGFNALALLNCAINPFLYTFLQPTLRVLCRLCGFVKEFTKKICFWYCTASEFDEFGKENPFCTEITGKDARALY